MEKIGIFFGLDCFGESMIRLAMTKIVNFTHPLAPSAREGEILKTIEVMAVWLCTALNPLQGNKTWCLLTKQGISRRVNCIPQNKLKIKRL